MPTAYCLTGYPGAGKSEATNIAQNLGYETVSMGDIVRHNAEAELGEGATEEEISRWATEARAEHGPTVIARRTVDAVTPRSDDIVVDGIRSPNELNEFEDAFDDVVVIVIDAPDELRRERISNRGRRNEDENTLRERDENEDAWGLAALVEMADYTVVNDGTLTDLEERLGDALASADQE